MGNIDRDIFEEQLATTQKYCELILSGEKKNAADILRSVRPTRDNKPVFSFKQSGTNSFECSWDFDPYDHLAWLFDEQMTYKKFVVGNSVTHMTNGRILVCDLDTVTDGASEVESLGFMDVYDLPPIDTWFYVENERRLYAWIPHEFIELVEQAVLVNPVDILHWTPNPLN